MKIWNNFITINSATAFAKVRLWPPKVPLRAQYKNGCVFAQKRSSTISGESTMGLVFWLESLKCHGSFLKSNGCFPIRRTARCIIIGGFSFEWGVQVLGNCYGKGWILASLFADWELLSKKTSHCVIGYRTKEGVRKNRRKWLQRRKLQRGFVQSSKS